MDRNKRDRILAGNVIAEKRAVVTAPLPIPEIEAAFKNNMPTGLPGKEGLWLVQSTEMEALEGGPFRWIARAIQYYPAEN